MATDEVWADPSAAHGRVRVVDPRTFPAVRGPWRRCGCAGAADRMAGAHPRPVVAAPHVTGHPRRARLVVVPHRGLRAARARPAGRRRRQSSSSRLDAADDAVIVSRSSLPRAVAHVAEVFGLSDIELRLICLVLAPELDGRYATVIGVLQNDLTRRRPGLTLLAELMAQTGSVPGISDGQSTRPRPRSSAHGLVQPAGSDGLPVDIGLAPSRAVVAHLLASSLDVSGRRVGCRAALAARRKPRRSCPTRRPSWHSSWTVHDRTAAMIHLVGGGPTKAWFPRLAAAAAFPLWSGTSSGWSPARSG